DRPGLDAPRMGAPPFLRGGKPNSKGFSGGGRTSTSAGGFPAATGKNRRGGGQAPAAEGADDFGFFQPRTRPFGDPSRIQIPRFDSRATRKRAVFDCRRFNRHGSLRLTRAPLGGRCARRTGASLSCALSLPAAGGDFD